MSAEQRSFLEVIARKEHSLLLRVLFMLTQRRYTIHSLKVFPIHGDRDQRLYVEISGPAERLEQVVKQIKKLVNVIEVTNYAPEAQVIEGSHPEEQEIQKAFIPVSASF